MSAKLLNEEYIWRSGKMEWVFERKKDDGTYEGMRQCAYICFDKERGKFYLKFENGLELEGWELRIKNVSISFDRTGMLRAWDVSKVKFNGGIIYLEGL